MICWERTYENLSEMFYRLSRQLSACFDISQSELDDWFDKIIAQEDNFEGKPDLREGKMIYANMEGDNTEIKDCFYLKDTDWCRYENVIVAMINRNFMDFSEGFPVIGGRIV